MPVITCSRDQLTKLSYLQKELIVPNKTVSYNNTVYNIVFKGKIIAVDIINIQSLVCS